MTALKPVEVLGACEPKTYRRVGYGMYSAIKNVLGATQMRVPLSSNTFAQTVGHDVGHPADAVQKRCGRDIELVSMH